MLGWEIGIDKNAKYPNRALESAVDFVLPSISPEMAIGARMPSLALIGNQVANQNQANGSKEYSQVFNFNIEHADLSNDQAIEDTSMKLARLTERQMRGRLQ